MPFASTGTLPLSSKDVLSFTFDDPQYSKDKPIFIDPEDNSRHYTYATARKTVTQLIAGLKASGVRPGDVVCIHSFNSILYPLLILAIIGAGGRSTGTNPSYTKAELNHAIKLAKAKFIFAEPEILPNMLDALRNNNIDVGKGLFVLDTLPSQKVPPNLQSWRSLLQYGSEEWVRFDDEQKSRNEVAQLYYTSGTTGLPKCAMTSHRNLTAQHQMFFEANPRDYPYRVALCMPFFHVGIAPQVFMSVIKEGREAYVMRRFDLIPYLNFHAKYQLTEIFSVPPMINAIVMSGLADPKSNNYRKDCSLKSVRNGTVGAAPCSGDLQRRFNELLGDGATFTQVWGMTETTTMYNIVPWDVARKCSRGELDAWGNVGVPLPGNTAKLVDLEGNDVTEQGRGEYCVKGPTVVLGYFENEKATAESWDSEGYYKTGDVMQVDKKTGMMYCVERVKELIKVRGFQVAPAELEGALTEHQDIVDAAVIGITLQDGTEVPKAYVVKRPNSSLTEEQVYQHMRARLAGYKQLGLVQFVEDIPKLPSGKILKRVLREESRKDGLPKPGPKL